MKKDKRLQAETSAWAKTALSVYHEEVLAQNEELKEAQALLEQSRDGYARLYDEAPVGYMTLDINGVVEKANVTALKLLGLAAGSVLGRPLITFVKQEDRPAFLDYLLICRSSVSDRKQWVEVRLRKRNRDDAYVQLSSVGVGRDSGKGMVFLTTLTDVTGRVLLENERRKAEERVTEAIRERSALQAASEAKDRFFAMLSHELRTPLTPALLRLSALIADTGIRPDVWADIKLIFDNVKLECRLIDDLLDINRILRGRIEPHFQPLNLQDVIRRTLQICEPEIKARRLTLVDAADGGALPVQGDDVRLQQVLWNVIRNAVKFTPEGGQIRISASCENGMILVAVKDTGVGIESQDTTRIFNVFEQGTDIAHRFGGLGLGLAISKAIVEAHHGRISAQSAGKDLGSTFTIVLPLDSSPAIPWNSPAEAPPAGVDVSDKALRILLVEDHAETRVAIGRLLRKRGYQLELAATATQAREIADQKEFDVVISDLGLPDEDGYQLMRELRARHNLKGIALSGYGMEQDQTKSSEAGFNLHIVKPVTIDTLENAIVSICQTAPATGTRRGPIGATKTLK